LIRSVSVLPGSSPGRSAPCCFVVSCGAEEASAGVSVEEVGLSSASLSAGLGLDGRVEMFGVSSALLAGSGSERRD
jgi:hypothetical protein